jgi:acetyl esterase/lipase
MPREPFHPLFGALPKTPGMMELQITQEYLGWSNHLVYLAPMWKEVFDADTFVKGPGSTVAKVIDGSLQHQPRTGIAGVANTGSDRNWSGHHFAAANWYAFGRLAWNSGITSEAIADEWIRQTWSRTPATVKAIAAIMLGSREAFVNYTMPLGLHHLIGGNHYAVMPENNDPRRLDWTATYYHKADAQGVGFDRTRAGTGAVDQYAKPNADRWNDPKTTPENFLLWFHHLPWDYKLLSGQTLWQAIVAHYRKGAEQAAQMEKDWAALKGTVDDERHAAVAAKMAIQTRDAAAWRDKCLAYFAKFSGQPIGATGPSAVAGAQAAGARVDRNVVYGMVSGLGLLMDVYRPAQPNGIGIVTIMGSGWSQPLRAGALQLKSQAAIVEYAERFAAAGYTAFVINHRSSPRFRYPDPVDDAQRAVRFIRAHKADYGLTSDRIGAWGASSGGHLAEMLGTLDGKGNPADLDPVERESAKVQAVVTLFAPSDLTAMFPATTRQGAIASLMGFEYRSPNMGGRPDELENVKYREASPITHVTGDDAPMLLYHGDQDPIVPIQQSELMEAGLKKAGVAVRFVRVPGGRHGAHFAFPDTIAPPDDAADAIAWFDAHLKTKP